MIRAGSTLAVGWLGDSLANALQAAFLTDGQPSGLTVVYAETSGDGRAHGLNLLAREGLVRRVIGGQWHPVPALHALARADRLEAYSLPAGVINWLFRDIAEGLAGHVSRSGLGTAADPRRGGGRLNRRTPDTLVRLVHAAGEEALLFRTFPIDVALVSAAFMQDTAAIVMSRDAAAIARAARKSGGIVIAQPDRLGTLDRMPRDHIEVPDTLIDVLVTTEPPDRLPETFGPAGPLRQGQRRLTD